MTQAVPPPSGFQPLEERAFLPADLVEEFPPVLSDPNKRIVFGKACPPGAVHEGRIVWSRWPAPPLPDRYPPDPDPAVELRPGIYTYGPPPREEIHWHVNFADRYLFVAYGSPLFAQDEMQAAEHPALGSLREVLLAGGYGAITVERGRPTPVLVRGVERRCRIAVNPDAAAGRPRGLYGNHFHRAPADAVRRAVEVLDPPTRTNLIAIEAPQHGFGPYTREDIRFVLETAHAGFLAARVDAARAEDQEGEAVPGGRRRVIVHTGFWGCGAYGGNRTLMTLLQLVAARMAGVDGLEFHTVSPEGMTVAEQAVAIHRELVAASRPVEALIEDLAGRGFTWGVSNGT